MRTILTTAVLLCLMALPSSASAQFWTQPGPPVNQTPSPILPSDGRTAVSNIQNGPVLADVGGVVHAAWTEWDGANFEVRVAKMVDGRWVPVGSGCSPINARSDLNAFDVSIADYQGRPVVAWSEVDGNSMRQVHAARFDPVAGEWTAPWGPVTNIAKYPPTDPPDPPTFYGSYIGGFEPQVLVVAGRLHVGYREGDQMSTKPELARLTTAGTQFEKLPRPSGMYDDYGFTRWLSDGSGLFVVKGDAVASRLYWHTGDAYNELPLPPQADPSTFVLRGTAVSGGHLHVMWSDDDEPTVRISRYEPGNWWPVTQVDLPDASRLAVVGETIYTFSGGNLHRRTGSGPWISLGAPDRGGDEGSLAPREGDFEIINGRAWTSWRQWNGESWDGRVARSLDAATAPGGEGTSSPPPGCGSAPPPDDSDGDGSPAPDAGSPSSPGGGGTTPVAGGSSSTSTVTPPVVVIRRSATPQVILLNRRVKLAKGRRAVRLRIRCAAAAPCRGTLVARGYSRGRGLELGRTRISLPAGRTATVTLPLNRRARTMLRRGSLRYELSVRPTG